MSVPVTKRQDALVASLNITPRDIAKHPELPTEVKKTLAWQMAALGDAFESLWIALRDAWRR